MLGITKVEDYFVKIVEMCLEVFNSSGNEILSQTRRVKEFMFNSYSEDNYEIIEEIEVVNDMVMKALELMYEYDRVDACGISGVEQLNKFKSIKEETAVKLGIELKFEIEIEIEIEIERARLELDYLFSLPTVEVDCIDWIDLALEVLIEGVESGRLSVEEANEWLEMLVEDESLAEMIVSDLGS